MLRVAFEADLSIECRERPRRLLALDLSEPRHGELHDRHDARPTFSEPSECGLGVPLDPSDTTESALQTREHIGGDVLLAVLVRGYPDPTPRGGSLPRHRADDAERAFAVEESGGPCSLQLFQI